MSPILDYLLLGLGVLNLAALIALWRHVDGRANDTSKLNDRVSRLETNITYLPRHRELTEIRASLSAVASDLAAMRERTETQAVMLRSIQSHLLGERP